MAYQSTQLLLLALLVITTAAPLAHGIVPPVGINVNVTISGQLVCSPSGNSLPGTNSPGIPGVNVTLICNLLSNRNVSVAVTSTSGLFNFTVSRSAGLPSIVPPPCIVAVRLPLPNCTATPTSGTLLGLLSLTSVVNVTNYTPRFVTIPVTIAV